MNPELKLYEDFRDFCKFNQKLIDFNPLLFFNLNRSIDRVLNGETVLYKFFNVLTKDTDVCCLFIEDEVQLYTKSKSISDEVVISISEGLEFKKFKRYQFFGTKCILDALFKYHDVKYTEQKHRNYYECKQVKTPFVYAKGTASNADIHDLEALKILGNQFQEDFYSENKPDYQDGNHILSGIISENIYCWSFENEILGMAQVIYEPYDFPVVGMVITRTEKRNAGVASSLVYKVTEGLLNNGFEKCCLMTDAYNPYSNAAFKKCGYELIGDYVMRYKEV